jgi:nitrogenase molybdenum-iron protein alpha chain
MSHINLQIPDVSIREIRLNSITGFQGSAEELVKYSRCGLKDKNRSFSQCLGCSTSQAACMVI